LTADRELREAVEALVAEPQPERRRALPVIEALLAGLESGRLRAAQPEAGGWRLNAWVKRGILLAFRIGEDRSLVLAPVFGFRDRDTLPPLPLERIGGGVRIVPGGTTIRRGAFLGEGVVVMPPAYVNVGAWVGLSSMIDSHALVGSCAQVGSGVHLSAGVQVGGVLEPVGAWPVILEDGVFVGGGCGIFEGTRVGSRAVLAPGVVLTRSTAVIDLVRECVHRAAGDEPLCIPPGAVVVPGARPASGEFARRHGVLLQAPVVAKYRDERTQASVVLEDALR
jgi:2,3,4,5-tetrahydropyridine-2-carboxylate N-succinyltransferase